MRKYAFLLVALCFVAVSVMPAEAVQKMKKETLVKLLDDPDTIVLDARRGYDWDASEFLIKGAVRIGQDVGLVKDEIPTNMTLVLYCAWPDEFTSTRVGLMLENLGYKKVYALEGGWREWFRAKFPVEEKD